MFYPGVIWQLQNIKKAFELPTVVILSYKVMWPLLEGGPYSEVAFISNTSYLRLMVVNGTWPHIGGGH